MKRYTIRLVSNPEDVPHNVCETVSALDAEIFPADKREEVGEAWWWLAYHGETPIGFGGLKRCPGEPNLFFCRAGVRMKHRKHGLYRRIISATIRLARKLGQNAIITYTHPLNASSINALVAKGYKSYNPEFKYVGDDMCYWYRKVRKHGEN